MATNLDQYGTGRHSSGQYQDSGQTQGGARQGYHQQPSYQQGAGQAGTYQQPYYQQQSAFVQQDRYAQPRSQALYPIAQDTQAQPTRPSYAQYAQAQPQYASDPRYAQAGAAQAIQPQGNSGLAIAGLVMGIVALITSPLPIVNNASFFIALIGAVLAFLGLRSIKAGKKTGHGMAVAGLVISVVAAVIVLVAQMACSAALDAATDPARNPDLAALNATMDKASGSATDAILADDLTVALGQFSAVDQGYGMWTTSLPVTLTNRMGETKSFSVQIEAVDAAGNRISTDYIYANNLGAGQTQSFDAFTLLTSDDAVALQSAAFNIVEVSEY